MTAYEYSLLYGEAGCARVAKEAGSNFAYFKHLCWGNRRPSADLARKLVAASAKFTPGNTLDLEGLLFPETRPAPQRKGRINWRNPTVQ